MSAVNPGGGPPNDGARGPAHGEARRPPQRQLTNDFSWSKSRHEKLSDCHRAYYLHYYGSWGGWERGAPERTRELFVLKKLGNRFTWSGNAVHVAVKRALEAYRHGEAVDADAWIEETRAQMRAEFAHSRARRYRRDRRTFAGLMEHEYDEPLEPAVWARNWENVEVALRGFLASRWPATARSMPAGDWIEIDEANFETSAFPLDGVKVFAVPDLAFREGDGARVVDWKTGAIREGHDGQVLGYALYLAHRYGIDPLRVRASLVYLNAGTEVEVTVSPGAVERFMEHFRGSVATMRGLLVDPEANVARPEADFPLTEDLRTCGTCAFRRICGRTGQG